MIKIFSLFICFLGLQHAVAQTRGEVIEIKDPLIDSLIARRIELNTKTTTTINPPTTVVFNGLGYRVQVFYGLDRKEAFSEQAKFRSLYPQIMTYISYNEPNYRLKVGDFRTRLEAQNFLNELRGTFPTLFIFHEKINAPDLETGNY